MQLKKKTLEMNVIYNTSITLAWTSILILTKISASLSGDHNNISITECATKAGATEKCWKAVSAH